MTETAVTASRVFSEDGQELAGVALVLEAGKVKHIVPTASLRSDMELVDLGEGLLAPGLVDLQVNGGGGVLLNDSPTLEGIEAICASHRKCGAARLLPTLISSSVEIQTRAIEAARTAADKGVPGFAGLHLEGPHLSLARKGIHSGALIRPMEPCDLDLLTKAAKDLPALMVTVAPETVRPDQVEVLVKAGAVVSLGHTDAPIDHLRPMVEAGVTCVTHLFNAMSQMISRAPGLVGLALDDGRLSAGLIADGHHADPVSMSVALRAKRGPGKVFLVSDAMHTVGSELEAFELDGRTIYRRDGRLTDADGTLAGADISLLDGVLLGGLSGLFETAKDAVEAALSWPAELMSIEPPSFRPGYDGPLVFLKDDWSSSVLNV